MKKIFVFLLMLLWLCPAALAQEDGFFTRSDDLCYHYNPACGGEEGRVPISEKAGKAFGKEACTVCIQAEDEALPPQAVARGGTIAVRFSQGWLDQQELSGVFGFMGADRDSGAQAHRLLKQYLHGDDYNAFLESWQQTGSAEGRANIPYILPAGNAQILASRRIGSDWYIIVRPGEKFSRKWEMYWRVSSYALRAEGDSLYSEFDLQTVEEHYPLQLESMNDSKAVYSGERDLLTIEVYEALGGSIAVIREKNAVIRGSEGVRLVIGGRDTGIEMSGYADGKETIYCCMLTDAELNQLRANARAELWHTEPVNQDIFRVNGLENYDYYSKISGEKLFSISKAEGKDPVDDDFRMIFDGDPDCFAVDDNTGVPVICRYLNSGREIITVQGGTGQTPDRLTPLFWYGEGGVFLAEAHKYEDYAVDDRLFENGIEYDVRFGSGPEDEWSSYLCWLVDESGEVIGSDHNQAYTLHEDGTLTFETIEGDTWSCDPRETKADD